MPSKRRRTQFVGLRIESRCTTAAFESNVKPRTHDAGRLHNPLVVVHTARQGVDTPSDTVYTNYMNEAFVVYEESALDGVSEVCAFASEAEAAAEVSRLREVAIELDYYNYVSYDFLPRAEFEAYDRQAYEDRYGEPAFW